jgi:hypothetical protein
MPEPKKPQPQSATIGRRVRGLPSATPDQGARAELKRRVEREAQLVKEKRELGRKLAQAELDKRLLGFWANIEREARRRAAEATLSGPDTTRLVNHLEREWKEYLAAEKPPERFDYNHALRTKLAELKGTLPPVPKAGPVEPLPQNEQQRLDAVERGRRMVEDNRRSREQYEATLKKYGLENPAHGSRYTGKLGL